MVRERARSGETASRPHQAHQRIFWCVCVRYQEGERTEVAILSLAAPLNQSESCRKLVEPHHRIDGNWEVWLVVGLRVYVY